MKKRNKWLLIIGLSLIAVSVCLVIGTEILHWHADKQAQKIVQYMETVLPARSIGTPESYNVMEMPALSVDGRDFIGLVDIPSHGVTLPICRNWKASTLPFFPCRFSGTVYDGSLIIGGGSRAFSCLKEMDIGDKVHVTDMQGAVFSYTVTHIRRANTADVASLQSDASLTLFVRDGYNRKYVIVECE